MVVVVKTDPQEEVFGCGVTAEEALQDWDVHVKERMEQVEREDEMRWRSLSE